VAREWDISLLPIAIAEGVPRGSKTKFELITVSDNKSVLIG